MTFSTKAELPLQYTVLVLMWPLPGNSQLADCNSKTPNRIVALLWRRYMIRNQPLKRRVKVGKNAGRIRKARIHKDPLNLDQVREAPSSTLMGILPAQ